jgi:glycine betaine/choline ABC-type transport system substrate-binding protein
MMRLDVRQSKMEGKMRVDTLKTEQLNAAELYLGDAQFESQLDHWLS